MKGKPLKRKFAIYSHKTSKSQSLSTINILRKYDKLFASANKHKLIYDDRIALRAKLLLDMEKELAGNGVIYSIDYQHKIKIDGREATVPISTIIHTAIFREFAAILETNFINQMPVLLKESFEKNKIKYNKGEFYKETLFVARNYIDLLVELGNMKSGNFVNIANNYISKFKGYDEKIVYGVYEILKSIYKKEIDAVKTSFDKVEMKGRQELFHNAFAASGMVINYIKELLDMFFIQK